MTKLFYLLLVFSLCIASLFSQQTADSLSLKKTFTNLQDALKNPDQVYRLDLSNQKLSNSVVNWQKFKNLEYLSLKNDHLKVLPAEIFGLLNLKTLDISLNDFETLSDDFVKFKNLEELYLNDEKNLNVPKTLKLLNKLPKLKVLHLEGDHLSTLPEHISELKNLQSLYLNNNLFKEVPAQIKGLDHLQYLDLNNNQIPVNLINMQQLNFGFKIQF
ncbi:MAG: leucine-rich repeat domain-containing protein [Flavobacterium sp.]|nr:leucine-rich repeat domain-containing protein [Flavobacterium sp.]